jgi:glycosyltransferase involved in cell wall biosynthesis
MGNRLKILFLSNRSPLPIIDGHTRRTYNILKGLAESHNVHFVSLYEIQEELAAKNVQQLESFCGKVEFYPAPSKVFCFEMLVRLICSMFSSDPYTIWRHYSSVYHNRVKQLINTGNYDIVHCDNLPVAYTVRYDKSVFRSITDHDVSYLKCARMSKESKNIFLKVFLYYEAFKLRNLEKQVLRLFDLGIVVSDIDKTKLLEICPEGNLLVIENGVDTTAFIPGAAIDNNTLVWVGGFKNFSNESAMHYFLTDIYPEIKLKFPDIRFNVIGDGISKRLNNLISSDSSICYLGFVDDPLPYIQKSAIFVVPIISGSGTRLKLLEAMSAGKATVTTEVGCEGIEGSDGIHFVVANSPRDFASAVINLMNDNNYRLKLELNARLLMEKKYDWNIITNKLVSAYSSIVANKNQIIKL